MRVYGMAKGFPGSRICGAAAEYMAISERCLARMPNGLNFGEAASFPLVALTTHQAIGKQSRDGVKVLILGGSGGVGCFAIQYAKARGCFVASTCSERNFDLLRELGCDQIINYQTEDWSVVLKDMDFDLIYDCVGGIEHWENATEIANKKGSHYVTITGDAQGEKLSVMKLANIAGSYINRNFWALVKDTPKYNYLTTDPTKGSKQLLEIRNLIEAGFIKPTIDKEQNIFKLSNLDEAFEKSMSGRTVGKLVVIVDDSEEKESDQVEDDQ